VVHSHRTYQPRDTEHSVLHAVIREHLEPFLREISDRGELAPVSRRPRAVCAPALTGRPLRPPGPWRHRPRGQPPRCRPHARLDLASVAAPRARPRCPRLSALWRPAARYRHRPGPLAVQAILVHLRRSGAPEPSGPAPPASVAIG